MKILNWLHRRLSKDTEYCRVLCRKRDGPFSAIYDMETPVECVAGETAGAEKEELLLGIHSVKRFHDLFEGFLAINALGDLSYKCHALRVDPLGDENQEQEQERRGVQLIASHHVAREPLQKGLGSTEDEIFAERKIGVEDEEDYGVEPLLRASKSEKRERVTLAELMTLERGEIERDRDGEEDITATTA